MIHFDSNILIYFIENNIDFGEQSAYAIKKSIDDDGVGMSVLAFTELFSRNISVEHEAKLKALQDYLQLYDIDTSVAKAAGKLRSKHNVKTPDALHIATALSNKATLFVTNDLDLTKLRIPKLKIVSLGAFVKGTA